MTLQGFWSGTRQHDVASINSLQQEKMHYHPGLRFVPAMSTPCLPRREMSRQTHAPDLLLHGGRPKTSEALLLPATTPPERISTVTFSSSGVLEMRSASSWYPLNSKSVSLFSFLWQGALGSFASQRAMLGRQWSAAVVRFGRGRVRMQELGRHFWRWYPLEIHLGGWGSGDHACVS
jgi:hypothetical protein